MVRVKMNSAIQAHPVTNGPADIIRIGLMTRKAIIASLYHIGACPRKVFINVLAIDFVISSLHSLRSVKTMHIWVLIPAFPAIMMCFCLERTEKDKIRGT